MKYNYLLLILLFSGHLSAQQMYQHPVLLLLGTDLHEIADLNTGLSGYNGLGKTDLLQAHSLLQGRRTNLSWVPFRGQPNGWGLLQLNQHGSNVTLSGSEQGTYEASASIPWQRNRWRQSTRMSLQSQQRLADRNQDGFRDQTAYRNFRIQQSMETTYNDFLLRGYFQYFKQQQHGGQLGYDWKNDAGSDSIYGFGRKLNQWIGGIGTEYTINKKQSLHLNTLWRKHDEVAYYGQRQLLASERRTGMVANYRFKHSGSDTRIFSYYKRMIIQQNWDNWQTNNKWNNMAIGGRHRRFLSSKWLIEGVLTTDYHTASNWQLLPSLRLDYLPHEKIRVAALAGKSYRWQRPVEALRPYLLSQRSWSVDSYGPDRLWYLGGLAQTDQINYRHFRLFFKLLYQARLLTEQLVTDPSLPNNLQVYHTSHNGPLQHLLMLTAQGSIKNFTANLVYRWRDKQLPFIGKDGQNYFESRHSMLAQIGYRKAYRALVHELDIKTDYLVRSPQPLPNGDSSPILHNWRCQVDVKWKNIANRKIQPVTFIGAENLLNQRQNQPYVAADMPFGESFDGSSSWGSPIGRRWFAGLKLSF